MIRIKSIKLENFRIHENLHLEFSSGTNVILGENGAGKTTIFIAIIFALFGAKALLESERAGRVENLIHRGKSRARVELTLIDTDTGEEYVIQREILGTSTSATLKRKKDNKVIEIISGSEAVTKYLLENVFKASDIKKLAEIVYIRQGELGQLVEEFGKVMSTKEFDNILGIEKYTKLIEIIKAFKNELELKLSVLKSNLEPQKNLIETFLKDRSLEDLENAVEERKKIENAINELISFKNKLEQINKLLSKYDSSILNKESELISEKEKIIEEINKVRNKESELINKLKDLEIITKEIEDYKNLSLEEIEKLLENIKIKYDKNEKERILIDLRNLEKIIRDCIELKNNQELINKAQEITEKEENIKKEKYALISKKRELEQLIELIKGKKLDKCPVCGSDIKDKYEKILEMKYKELNKIMERIRELENELISLQNERKKIEQLEKVKYKVISEAKKYIKLENEDLDSILQAINELHSNLKNILEEYVTYEKLISAKNIKTRERIEKELHNLKTKESKLSKRLTEIEKTLTEIKNIKELISEKEKIIDEMSKKGISSLEELNKKLKQLESKKEELPPVNEELFEKIKKAVTTINQLEKKINIIEKNIKELQKLIKILESVKINLRVKSIMILSYYFKKWFKQLYVYPDIEDVNIKLTRSKRAKDETVYEIYVKLTNDTKERNIIEAGLSGGQKVIIDLALRFALISLFSRNIGFILLDEPTHSLDENIRIKFAEVLKQQTNLQIIVCTHDELFRDSISGKGYILKRNELGKIEVKEVSV